MLTIRDEQIATFEVQAKQRFETKLVRHIANCYPEEYAQIAVQGGEKQVRQLIRDSVSRAGGYGINTERALAGFIDLVVCFGLGFESLQEMEWAKEILADDSLGGPTKIEMVFALLPEE